MAWGQRAESRPGMESTEKCTEKQRQGALEIEQRKTSTDRPVDVRVHHLCQVLRTLA